MKILLFVCTLLFMCQLGKGQEISLSQINSLTILDYFQQNNTSPLPDAESIVLATQIGDHNTIVVADRSSGHLLLSQIGSYNNTYFINPSQYPANAEISVKGSGNYIDITGSNSISEGMKININANDMTIFMRNY